MPDHIICVPGYTHHGLVVGNQDERKSSLDWASYKKYDWPLWHNDNESGFYIDEEKKKKKKRTIIENEITQCEWKGKKTIRIIDTSAKKTKKNTPYLIFELMSLLNDALVAITRYKNMLIERTCHLRIIKSRWTNI